MLISEKNFKKLDSIIDRILSICWKKNMKLNPSKFKIGHKVEFGGTLIKYSKSNKRIQITPSEEKVKELLGKDPPKTKKELQSILGSLNQLTAWIPQIKCRIPLMRKLSGANNKFEESKQLTDEFNSMKHHLKKTIVLWPLEVGREIYLHTDASSQGLGFILSQPHKDEENRNSDHYCMKRNIITLGSAGLTSTQERYSSGEQECLAVLHAIQKTDYYVRGAPKVVVFTDNKNLSDYFKMGLHEIKNERILKFREKLLGYNLEFVHVKGSTHSVADRLPRYPEKENKCLNLEDRFVPSVA